MQFSTTNPNEATNQPGSTPRKCTLMMSNGRLYHFIIFLFFRTAASFVLVVPSLKLSSPLQRQFHGPSISLQARIVDDGTALQHSVVTTNPQHVYDLTRQAMELEGRQRCNALEELQRLCTMRQSYSFYDCKSHHIANTDSSTVIQKIPLRLSQDKTDAVNSIVK